MEHPGSALLNIGGVVPRRADNDIITAVAVDVAGTGDGGTELGPLLASYLLPADGAEAC